MSDEIPEIDTLGLLCPLPVLKLRKRMQPLASGDCICLIADDPASIIDVPHFCNEQGHTLVSQHETDGQLHYVVKKG